MLAKNTQNLHITRLSLRCNLVEPRMSTVGEVPKVTLHTSTWHFKFSMFQGEPAAVRRVIVGSANFVWGANSTRPRYVISEVSEVFLWAADHHAIRDNRFYVTVNYAVSEVICIHLRGAWRDHRLPEPFSWFLHETDLESLKITSARCFLLKCQRKVSKKRMNTASFVASLGAGVQPRSTVQLFMPVSGVEKPPFSQFFLGFGVSFGEEKPFVTSNVSF